MKTYSCIFLHIPMKPQKKNRLKKAYIGFFSNKINISTVQYTIISAFIAMHFIVQTLIPSPSNYLIHLVLLTVFHAAKTWVPQTSIAKGLENSILHIQKIYEPKFLYFLFLCIIFESNIYFSLQRGQKRKFLIITCSDENLFLYFLCKFP